jgi:uncharacterized membrane protein YccC
MTQPVGLGAIDDDNGAVQPSVVLSAGWLPGSTDVSASASASLESGRRRRDRVRLAPYTRAAIQVGLAVGAAIALGDLLSGRRFYWAVTAAFTTFAGANNSGEQVRKAVYRVIGTVIGVGIGSLLVTVVGRHTTWALAVILLSLFLGLYLTRISYAFLAVAITIVVAQLYVQLNEFSNSLLLVRLEETGLGAAVAIVVVVLVLPLRTRRVLEVATRDHVQALGRLVDYASGYLLGERDDLESRLRTDARDVDASYQVVSATAKPLRRTVFGTVDETVLIAVGFARASRDYSRNLIADVERTGLLDSATRGDIERARATLLDSLNVVALAITGPRDGIYTRSSALFDRAELRLEQTSQAVEAAELAIRDLKGIDGVMAQMAQIMGLTITDFDTTLVR